jgi:thiol-disulfide isomerase/thioredoxin
VVVSATWCKPCRLLKESLIDVMSACELNVQVNVQVLDVDEDEEACDVLNVTKLPLMVFTIDGVEKDRHIGTTDVPNFMQRCKTHLAFDNHFG